MKAVECIIRPAKLDAVLEELREIGVPGATAIEVKGFGRQRGRTARYRGGEMEIGFVPKVLLRIVVSDKDVERIIQTVQAAAKTGEVGDGKIFVTSVDEVVRIRTGEKGEKAL